GCFRARYCADAPPWAATLFGDSRVVTSPFPITGHSRSRTLAVAATLVVVVCIYFWTAVTELHSSETTLRIPRQYSSDFSYPGLWFVSGADDSNPSAVVRLSVEETYRLLPGRAPA